MDCQRYRQPANTPIRFCLDLKRWFDDQKFLYDLEFSVDNMV